MVHVKEPIPLLSQVPPVMRFHVRQEVGLGQLQSFQLMDCEHIPSLKLTLRPIHLSSLSIGLAIRLVQISSLTLQMKIKSLIRIPSLILVSVMLLTPFRSQDQELVLLRVLQELSLGQRLRLPLMVIIVSLSLRQMDWVQPQQ